MYKKVLAICAALVALAVVPAVASASPVLTENGVRVLSAGEGNTNKLTAIGEETSTLTTPITTVSCNDFWMTGSVHRNTANTVEGTIERATFRNETEGVTEDCSSSLGKVLVEIPALTNEGGTSHWCVTANAESADHFEVRGRNCTETGAGILTFALNMTSLGVTCRYKRENSVTGSFNTGGTVATLKVEGEPEFVADGANSGFCPVSGKISKMNFRLYTDTSTEALSTNDPLTIS